MITLTINGKSITVPKGTTVYKATQQLGIDVPIFCYQDRMPPFGACRMCLVEVEKMPKLQTSCTLEATEGMVVKTQSEMAVKGREGILEFLLINHPLDCPICDKGGECPLQDQTLDHGPGLSRFFEEKRRFLKPISLGPVLKLDRERCIVCARCTRFGDVLAGDHALEFIERGFKTEVGTPDGGPAESKFIGNTITICPVGALTSDVYRFRARPWDNDSTNSTCTLCPVGCGLILDARDGEIMRTRALENRDVNDMWLCDKGWFGYEFTYHPERLQKPLMRKEGVLQEVSWDEALTAVAMQIQTSKPKGKLAAWGGNPLTVEENYLFQQLMRTVAGVNHVDHRVGMPLLTLDEEGAACGWEQSIGECEELAYGLLLGVDLTEEFPVVWLRLRQAINKGAPIQFFGHFAPEMASYLSKTVLHAPGKELETLRAHLPQIKALADSGKKGALLVGRQYLNSPYRKAILAELQHFQKSMPNLTLNLLEGRGNSYGARFAGMRPDLGPCGEKLTFPGWNILQVVEAATKTGWDFLYVAGANPAQKYASKLWNEARGKLRFLVVQDLFLTETAKQADIVLPTLCFVEKGGSFLNMEGRVQTLMPGKVVPDNLYSDAEIFLEIAKRLNQPLQLDTKFTNLLKPGRLIASHKEAVAPPATVPAAASIEGGLLATFAPALFDHGVRMKHDPHVIQLAKSPKVRMHLIEGAKRGIKEGDKIRLSANGNSLMATVKLDAKVAAGTIVVPLGFPEIPVQELDSRLLNGLPIEVSK